MNTKLVLISLGIATLVATPAFAQKQHRAQATDAYASAHPAYTGSLTYEGRVIGTDPDPSIRSELLRDAPTYTTGN
jgi:hypothetical protein